jgi:biotin transport system permease protein
VSRTRQAPGSYRPGVSLLHRARPGAKLLGLLVLGVCIVMFREWIVGLAALALSLSLAYTAGLRGHELWRITRAFAIFGVLLFVFQTWQQGWHQGVAIVSGVFALIVAASAVTASTAVTDMLDTVVWLLRPFRRLGVSPERVSLAFSLAFRSLPVAYELAAETREAARARGLERNPRALLIPFVLRMVLHAQHTGSALHARGIDDD